MTVDQFWAIAGSVWLHVGVPFLSVYALGYALCLALEWSGKK